MNSPRAILFGVGFLVGPLLTLVRMVTGRVAPSDDGDVSRRRPTY
ncbi:hypothetical protein [Lelliottia amnigena]